MKEIFYTLDGQAVITYASAIGNPELRLSEADFSIKALVYLTIETMAERKKGKKRKEVNFIIIHCNYS